MFNHVQSQFLLYKCVLHSRGHHPEHPIWAPVRAAWRAWATGKIWTSWGSSSSPPPPSSLSSSCLEGHTVEANRLRVSERAVSASIKFRSAFMSCRVPSPPKPSVQIAKVSAWKARGAPVALASIKWHGAKFCVQTRDSSKNPLFACGTHRLTQPDISLPVRFGPCNLELFAFGTPVGSSCQTSGHEALQIFAATSSTSSAKV